MRDLTAAARIDGLDVARALAVLGMVAAHVGDDGTRGTETDGWAWLRISHGLPSSLFAVLAGISMMLMLTRRGTIAIGEVDESQLSRTRTRIAVRAGILIVMGVVLESLGTYVAIILINLGVAFLLALPLLRWPRRWLMTLAAVLVVGGGWIARELGSIAESAGIAGLPVIDTFWDGHYPASVWMAYVAVGLALGRLHLRSDGVAGQLMLAGAGVLVMAVAGGYLLTQLVGAPSEWISTEPHSYTPVEMALNLGAGVALIGGCLWLTRRIPRLLWPLRATGSMALTVYVLQIFVIAWVGNEIITEPTNVALVVLCAALVGFACVWRAFFPQGPLERMLSSASNAAADRRERTTAQR